MLLSLMCMVQGFGIPVASAAVGCCQPAYCLGNRAYPWAIAVEPETSYRASAPLVADSRMDPPRFIQGETAAARSRTRKRARRP